MFITPSRPQITSLNALESPRNTGYITKHEN